MHASAIALQLVDLLFRKESLQPVGGERAGDDLLAEHEVADLVLPHKRLELAVREVLHVRGEHERLDQQQRENGRDEIRDGELLLLGFHAVQTTTARRTVHGSSFFGKNAKRDRKSTRLNSSHD